MLLLLSSHVPPAVQQWCLLPSIHSYPVALQVFFLSWKWKWIDEANLSAEDQQHAIIKMQNMWLVMDPQLIAGPPMQRVAGNGKLRGDSKAAEPALERWTMAVEVRL
jgi:hypothetical protein